MSELPIAGSYRPTITLAAQRILDRGGNAVDAGMAAGLCTCVLWTAIVDLAGVAPIVIYLAAEDRVVTISGLGRWPRAASVAYFQARHGPAPHELRDRLVACAPRQTLDKVPGSA